MIHIPFEKPEDIRWLCKICGEEMIASYHWVFSRWMHPTVHDRCVATYNKNAAASQSKLTVLERDIPERFLEFDHTKANTEAMQAASEFLPNAKLKSLVIVGVRARGKSRIMWASITGFFDTLRRETGAQRWPEYFLFPDLISELDRAALNRFKLAKYAFLDDVGSVESYGRERAALQQVIRSRIQKNESWTWLTVDNMNFDPGLEDLCRDRALVVWVDK
jgi:DNA replication protein DnaC